MAIDAELVFGLANLDANGMKNSLMRNHVRIIWSVAQNDVCRQDEPELYFLEAHSIKGIIAFPKATPSSVSEYSTLGGISANAFLLIRPAFSSSFSLLVRVFGFISPSLCWSSLNLTLSHLPTVHTIWSAHFLLMTSIIPSNGQIHSKREL
jgi:hypothetical protein